MGATAPRRGNGVVFAAPTIRKITNFSGLGRVEQVESIVENGKLLRDIEWFAERMAEGPAKEQGARRFHLFSHAPQDRDGDRRYARRFDCPLNQSDGLIAKPSSRSEKCNIRLLRNHAGDQLGKNFLLEYCEMRPGDMAHEGVVARRQFTDEAL